MNVLKFKNSFFSQSYLTVSILGRSFKLNIKYTNTSIVELNKNENSIELILPKQYKNAQNMDIINLSIQKLYNKIAETEIEYAMEVARHLLKFAPEDYKIERIPNEFYKCSKNKIIINPDIVQYNREIINTTIIQAFCRTKYRINSNAYKKQLEQALDEYEIYKSKINIEDKFVKVS